MLRKIRGALMAPRASSFHPHTTRRETISAKGVLTAGNANAYAFAWQNPESERIIIEDVIIHTTTAGGTVDSVLDVGSAATATTASDNLIDGADLNATATYLAGNGTNAGTNGKGKQVLDKNGGTTDHVTGRILVAHAAALVGTYEIRYSILS